VIWIIKTGKIGTHMADAKERVDSKEGIELTRQDTAAIDKDKQQAQEFAGGTWSEEDDPSIPAFTVRAVFLGVTWAIFLACCNVAFGTFRTNWFNVPSSVATLAMYPMGVFLATIFRSTPFTIKEHVVASVLASAAGGTPYGINNVVAQYFDTLINDKNITIYNSLAWIFCTQFIGFGLAGLCRRFLVKPAGMMWPTALPTVTLFNSLHSKVTAGDLSSKYKLSRFKMFLIAAGCMFVYHWIPNYFATGLSIVSFICLISSNKTLNFMASGRAGEGIGVLSLTFDYTVATQFLNGQLVPFWVGMNFLAAYAFWGYFVAGFFYFANPLNSPKLAPLFTYNDNENVTLRSPISPMNIQRLYNKDGKWIQVKRGQLLNANNNDLNVTYYEANRPIYLTATFGVNYFSSFINIGAVIAHCYLWYGADVVAKVKDMLANRATHEDDVHNRLMSKYKDFPDLYYAIFLFVMLGIAFAVTNLTPFKLPWWGPLFGLLLGFVYVVPVGILFALTGYMPGLNIITQLIIGFLLPGKTIENMVFKSYGYNIMLQALELCAQLKVSHYLHVSPMAITIAQLIGTGIGVVCNTGTAFFFMDSMKELLLNDAQWKHNGPKTFTTAGGIWGAMGPARFFGMDSPYWWTLTIGVPLGFSLPFIPFLLNKYFPRDFWYLINVPILTAFQGGQGRDAATIIMPFLICWFFNYYLFRFKKEWWTKYNFIMSVGFDFGVSMCILVIFVLDYVKALPEITGWQSSDQGTYYCRGDTFESAKLASG
jgi:OPT family small oligopeptide transporter